MARSRRRMNRENEKTGISQSSPRSQGNLSIKDNRASASRQQEVKNSIESNGKNISQFYFDSSAKDKYKEAKTAWSKAYDNLLAFDNSLDTNNIPGLPDLKTNVDNKASKAAGASSGESYETFHWKVESKNSVLGPGGSSGNDIKKYNIDYQNWKYNSSIVSEVKSVSSQDTYNSSVINALLNGVGTIHIYYDGAHDWQEFKRVGKQYEYKLLPGLSDKPYAYINWYRKDGTFVRTVVVQEKA